MNQIRKWSKFSNKARIMVPVLGTYTTPSWSAWTYWLPFFLDESPFGGVGLHRRSLVVF